MEVCMSVRRFHSVIFLFVAVVLVVSCAPRAGRQPVDLAWPLPPEKPRIKFIRAISSSEDFVKKEAVTKMMDSIFGDIVVDTLGKPYGIAVDRMGRVYVTDIGRVWMMDLEKGDLQFIGTKPGTGRVSLPIGIDIASDGRIFVGDINLDRVFVYDEEGRFLTAIGEKGALESPSGIAIDDERGRVYVVDSRKHFVNVYSLDNYKFIQKIGERGHEEGMFNFPTNIALNSEGNLYVVDTNNFRVQIFDPDGNFLSSFGQVGDAFGTFTRPKGIGIDSEDHVYVVDAAFQNIQVFGKEGKQFLMVFGGSGFGPGLFSLPAGMTVDHQDKLYVVDQLNRRIQIFQYLSYKDEEEPGDTQGDTPGEERQGE